MGTVLHQTRDRREVGADLLLVIGGEKFGALAKRL